MTSSRVNCCKSLFLPIRQHGPSLDYKHKIFGHNELAPGFYSNLEYMLSKANYWIYGHTHSNLFKLINKTRLISNQRGYPNEGITDFDPGLVIEL